MCEYLKRMSPQDTPTDDIRLWSGLTHSVVEYTGPGPFGMDGSVCLWLHERSATQLLDMCDELDAKFSDLKSENAKLREYVNAMAIQSYKGEMFDCGYCPFSNQCYNGEPKEHQGRGCQWWLWARELGVEVSG